MKKISLSSAWQFHQAGTSDWLSAAVPGGVHTDLLALGRIPDPFVGDNELQVQWVAEADWEYRRNFTISAELLKEEHVRLVCDGLDTLARVSINGTKVGTANNMFRTWSWDVKPLLKAGVNEIVVYFDSTVAYITEKLKTYPLLEANLTIPGGPHVRKAPCHFGWDWGPMLPPIGIWKDLRLEGYSTARIEDVHLQQVHTGKKVRIEAALKLENWDGSAVSAELKVTAPDGKVFNDVLILKHTGTLAVDITDPKMWWPNGYGAQPLYKVEVTLRDGDKVLDVKPFQMGLRTLELLQELDEWGRSFIFVVNGVKIFAKGSDWIPTDSFPTRITKEILRGLLQSAVDTYQNMLRVWGGGFYETEDFYDLCDELGILVWQDFIFACAIYPLEQKELVENIRVEVEQNVRRLRHRASLALWCGNNENEWGWEAWAWKDLKWGVQKAAYQVFYYRTLPEWLKVLDPATPYWPSSPSSGTPFVNVNGQESGDAHYWDVWHGRKPFTAYRDQYPRFMSEFGFQSLPPMPTVRTYAEPKDFNMTSYLMEYHQRSPSGNGLMLSQMTDTFRMPKDFEALVYLSMVLQAEGIRYGVEHWRRNNNRVSGILYWQLNDCWPVASWSSLDYYGRWKALHYETRRFFSPVMLSILDQKNHMEVHVTSDLLEPWQGRVEWALQKLDGTVLQSGQEAVQVKPQSNTSVCTHDFDLTRVQTRQVVFVARLFHKDKEVACNVATFIANKHLELAAPQLKVEAVVKGNQVSFELSAVSLARFVELSLEGMDVVFSDNYFDVVPGKKVHITCPQPKDWDAARIQKALHVQSLWDSF